MLWDAVGMIQLFRSQDAEKYAGENKKLLDTINDIIYNGQAYSNGYSEQGLEKWKIGKGNSEEFSDIKDLVCDFFTSRIKK